MKPYWQQDGNEIYQGNCNEIMRLFPDNHFSSIITDPPYGLEFMGKEWDKLNLHNSPKADGNYPKSRNIRGMKYGEANGLKQQKWHYKWAKEALRVAKPGAFLLAFGGTRTHHRLMCAIEDAGWEIRDCMMWLYGSGFPKSLDISKAIDKAAGAERKVVGIKPGHEEFANRGNMSSVQSFKGTLGGEGGFSRPWMDDPEKVEQYHLQTAPSTLEAQLWDGYGTALKPAWEPIIVAMKPVDGTFANNALNHGVAGLNIDACRIRTDDDRSRPPRTANAIYGDGNGTNLTRSESHPKGRFPANIILTHHPECEMVGMKKIKAIKGGTGQKSKEKNGRHKWKPSNTGTKGDLDGTETIESWNCHPDCPVRILDEQSGERHGCQSPSNAKPKSKFRPNQGNYMPQGQIYNDTGTASRFFYCAKASRSERGKGNKHPTVKPLALIKYLIELVAPPKDALILDMFFGSGSLGVVCEELGIKYVGIDLDIQYAIPRIEKAKSQLKLFN